jgi:hypothetical protein
MLFDVILSEVKDLSFNVRRFAARDSSLRFPKKMVAVSSLRGSAATEAISLVALKDANRDCFARACGPALAMTIVDRVFLSQLNTLKVWPDAQNEGHYHFFRLMFVIIHEKLH